ncbi:hypothetical protein BBF96_10555 [Anoxybacter fermentans]|uniref:DUF2680 domain-containing protein n=1 Tax=Anoxybacter fermentans TaxID=1323375 RepID=A0A3Q9HRP1_9FIRM|nr:hypothetical protein [Anoxybacter fermentans]AZR73787.1 hypothetical protein BBF96_10555 [Anoxybacter fermentans]
MKKVSLILVVLALLGLITVPAFAFGGWGFGLRGFINSLSEEDYARWLKDQVEDGWLTQKQADYMLEMYKRRTQGWTEEEYNAWVDQQLNDGWITKEQAEYLKERYKVYKERFGDSVPFIWRGGYYGCPYWFKADGPGFGGWGHWGYGPGMMGRRWGW